MRVGFLLGSPKIGGAERQVLLLARGVRATGHEAFIYFMERAGRRPPGSTLDFSALPHRFLGAGRFTGWLATRRLRRGVRDAGLNALVAFNVDAMEMAARALRSTGVRSIGSVRGLGFTASPRVAGRLEAVCRRMEHVTCNSPAIARALVERGICGPDSVQLLRNVIEAPGRITNDAREGYTVLFVGNLLPVKRPLTFVESCLLARRRCPDLRAVVAGDGPLAGAMIEAARDHADAFSFLGHVDPGAVPFDRADVVVSTSVREGCSNALLEAMAAGVPVVATRAGGSVDLVEESGAGILVPIDDSEALSDALVELRNSSARRRELGDRGRRFVERLHDGASVTARLIDLAGGRSG